MIHTRTATRTPQVFCDIDGVLADTVSAVSRALFHKFGFVLPPQAVTQFDIVESAMVYLQQIGSINPWPVNNDPDEVPLQDQIGSYLKMLFNDHEFFRFNVTPYPDMHAVLLAYHRAAKSNGWGPLHFITRRVPSEGVSRATRAWLDRFGFKGAHCVHCHNKLDDVLTEPAYTDGEPWVYIEDSLEEAMEAQEMLDECPGHDGQVFLVSRSWNQTDELLQYVSARTLAMRLGLPWDIIPEGCSTKYLCCSKSEGTPNLNEADYAVSPQMRYSRGRKPNIDQRVYVHGRDLFGKVTYLDTDTALVEFELHVRPGSPPGRPPEPPARRI